MSRAYANTHRDIVLRYLKAYIEGTHAESNPKAKNRRPEEFMDLSYMEELEKSGFINKVWQ